MCRQPAEVKATARRSLEPARAAFLQQEGPRLGAPSKLSSPLEKCLRSLSSSAALILACDSLFRSACEFWPSCLHRGGLCSIERWATELHAKCCSESEVATRMLRSMLMISTSIGPSQEVV